eukprot:TRINITY_DN25150_c0_g1_i1.p1 TRINITY_DN25150_c0_g1~~TRINITY_DN25150_c0_g1_i1.p1  ORF type:complete len:645 (+),score=115.53 TRINITY_DN25150_c0_g1_i1:298-2232(+)
MVKRDASEALAEPGEEICPICCWQTGEQSTWQPQIRAPFQKRKWIRQERSSRGLSCTCDHADGCTCNAVPLAGQDLHTMRCHLECLQWLMWQEGGVSTKFPDYVVEPRFEADLIRTLKDSPELFSRGAQVRLCFEEMRVVQAVAGCWPPVEPPTPSLAAFCLEGLEGNPLSAAGLQTLLQEARTSNLQALGLDFKQVQGCTKEEEVPQCVTVGNDVSGTLAAKYYMKVVRASQLRREPGVRAAGTPGGPPTSEECPAELIVVAFAASQGEPEWLGVLRRLAASKRVSQLPPSTSSLANLLEPCMPDRSLQENVMAKLWSKCQVSAQDTVGNAAMPNLPLCDFDVLIVVDHCMRWYSEDAQQFAAALNAVVGKRKKSLFVGASMGGFGALLHGGRLANAVLTFGPQSRLEHACLRPPAENIRSLEALANQCRNSVEQANARGACVEVHCAADEHGWHGLCLPLADLCLTVHPLLPRKPFAKLLDRAELLAPVLSDAVYRLLQTPAGEAGRQAVAMAEPRINVAQWTTSGALFRYWATRNEVLQALFGSEQARNLPRPGDWFCGRCGQRNMSARFFCAASRLQGDASSCCTGSLLDLGVTKIPGSNRYPRPGDWGCGKCGAALCAYDRHCPHCWGARDHVLAKVVT